MTDEDLPNASPLPAITKITVADLRTALAAGWRDFRAAPALGLALSAFYVICGLALWWLTRVTGQYYWLVIGVFGFPLVGPFAAVALYEISHRLEQGRALDTAQILGVVWQQRKRQLPSLCAILILIFLFWSFVGHMIFALFLGLQTMTNISSSLEVFLTPNGLAMLAFGTAVGAVLAGVVFAISVMGLPLLLDLELDFITAMIVSFQTALQNFAPMLIWGLFITVAVLLAMLPMFLGLLLVLPVLGHASWHLYRRTLQ